MSERIALGIDPGTHLGWTALMFGALRRPTIIGHGSYHLKAGRYEGQGMVFLRFDEFLKELFELVGPDALFQEEVARHSSNDASHKYGAITHAVMTAAERADVPYGAVPIGTWKKYGCGKGNAGKEIVKARFLADIKPHDATEWTQDEIDSYYIGAAAGTALWVRG